MVYFKIMKKFLFTVFFAVFVLFAVTSVSTAGIVSGLGEGVHVEDDAPESHAAGGAHLKSESHDSHKKNADNGVHIDKDTHTGKGVHLSDLYDSKGSQSAGHAHTKDGAGIELDKKAPCDSIFDCGCFGCQKSDGAVAAFLSVAESYVPEQYMAPVRTFATKYLSAALDYIYDDLYGEKPQKPPQH